ncbi:MAG TPA: translation elongation factor Ts [Gammaproteobacteria bacterium]|nr:translation elongation factor Ts [Gammaproteobacteria bacterium]
MADISAKLVKELRERTGAGMMECKKALVATGGDLDAAVEEMRKSGLAKADKKAGRVAAEGCIVLAQREGKAVLVEINSETDFVAKDENFRQFADVTARTALNGEVNDVEALKAAETEYGKTVEEGRQWLVATVGENVQLRRVASIVGNNHIGAYLHGDRIGVLVEIEGGDETLARDIAMHIAASRPVCVKPEDVPAETIAKEREIVAAQAAESGKPDNIIEKMVEGRMQKFLNEVALVGQPFVKDPDKKVGKLLIEANAKVLQFVRFEVGEGIEKKAENFADEVMAQVKGKD